MLLSTLVVLVVSADPFAVLEVQDAGWTYVESGADAGAASHTWTTRDVTHIGPYTSFWLQGDDVLPTVRLFVGPKGLSAAVDPQSIEELSTPAAIGKRWSTPQWGLFLPSKLTAGTKVRHSFADAQMQGTLSGTVQSMSGSPGGVTVVSKGKVCFLGECEQHTVELAFVPGVGFTRLCLDGAPTCFELAR